MKSYEHHRDDIKTGDVFFTVGNGFFSSIIQLFTGSYVSHTGLFIWIGKRLFIVESMEGTGVRILPASNYIKKLNGEMWRGRLNHRFTEQEVLDRVFGDIQSLPQIGEEYDMVGALLALFWDTKSQEVFCSEYVKKILDIKFPSMRVGITPRDISLKSIFLKKIK